MRSQNEASKKNLLRTSLVKSSSPVPNSSQALTLALGSQVFENTSFAIMIALIALGQPE